MKKKLPSFYKILSFFLLIAFGNFNLQGQIIISEFSCANQGDYFNADGDDNRKGRRYPPRARKAP